MSKLTGMETWAPEANMFLISEVTPLFMVLSGAQLDMSFRL